MFAIVIAGYIALDAADGLAAVGDIHGHAEVPVLTWRPGARSGGGAGQQEVDDLDTYEFHVEPKKEDKGKRYFVGRIWVDAQDFQIVKLCGKSGPEKVQVKKHERQELRPTFVTYRQQVDGRYWFPAYTRSDDTLHFKNGPVHMRETIKYGGYKRGGP